MDQINVILDNITLLLTREPFEFEGKKMMFIQLLSFLISLEKHHKAIIAVQRWMLDVGLTEKNSRAEESNNIIVFCNGPLQSINFMELKFQKQKALIESKQKLVDALEEIHLNQRLLLAKSKVETERSQLKLNNVRSALHSVLEAYKQIHPQNEVKEIKIDGIFEHMKSIEDKLEKRVVDFDLCIKELNKSLTDISNASSKKEKKLTIEQDISKDSFFSEINFLNVFGELDKIVNCSDQNMEEFQPLEIISQDERLLDFNLTDFHKNYNFANKILLLNMQKNYDSITSVNAVLNNLNAVEQAFDSNLKNIGIRINNVLNKRDESILVLKKLNDQLKQWEKKKNSLMVGHQNIDHLIIKSNEDISNLEKKIKKSNIKLTATVENNQLLRVNILSLDDIFNQTYKKSKNEINNHHKLLWDDEQPSKVTYLYEELDSAKNDRSALLGKRKEIMAEQVERKKRDIETTIKKKSDKVIETSNVIKFYKNKMPIYKQFVEQLKSLAVSKENVKKDLLLVHEIKTLQQLNDEEMELKGHINSYQKELHELNTEDDDIEKYSKVTELNMNADIKKMKEKLQLITNANTNLETELNKNKHVRVPK